MRRLIVLLVALTLATLALLVRPLASDARPEHCPPGHQKQGRCEPAPSPTDTPPPPVESPTPTQSPPNPSPSPSESPTPPPSDCIGVSVAPGADLARTVSEHPIGTTFCLSGDYRVSSPIVPRQDQSFIGPARLLGSTSKAFDEGGTGVTLRALEVTGFSSAPQDAAVEAGERWTLQDLNVHHNDSVGVDVESGSVVRASRIRHNGQLGVKATNAVDVLYVNNEIAWNNFEKRFSFGWEAGGSKFWRTTRLTLRANHVHDNWGPGLWTDNGNRYTLFEGNLVVDNADAGIFHEISCEATIRNNVIRRNGFERGDWLWGSGIQIASSGHVLVENNTLEGNANGIGLSQQDRESTDCGASTLQDVTVRNNTVSDSQGTGAVQDTGADIWNRGITFTGNTYSGQNRWAWRNRWLSLSEWQGYHPQDGS